MKLWKTMVWHHIILNLCIRLWCQSCITLKIMACFDVYFFDSHLSAYNILFCKSLDARSRGIWHRTIQSFTRDVCLLWNKGIFFKGTGIGLLKHFRLKAGDEHHALSAKQFHFGISDGCNYNYVDYWLAQLQGIALI